MEYHSSKFEDHSLLIYKDDNVIALLPANFNQGEIYSHQGLSYGGLVLASTTRLQDVVHIVASLLKAFHDQDISFLNLKLLPKIYHSWPSDEIDYLLFILNAQLVKAETLSVVNPKHVNLSRDRKQGINRAEKQQLEVREVGQFEDFWNAILIPNLSEKHGVTPVHSLEDITYLKSKFPDEIRQFNVYKDEKIVGGTTIFETELVAHSQYISANSDKNQLGTLDKLHWHLLTKVFNNKSYFDFGSSNENNGQHINQGLNYWKEGFGARTIIHQFYRIETANFNSLNTILL